MGDVIDDGELSGDGKDDLKDHGDMDFSNEHFMVFEDIKMNDEMEEKYNLEDHYNDNSDKKDLLENGEDYTSYEQGIEETQNNGQGNEGWGEDEAFSAINNTQCVEDSDGDGELKDSEGEEKKEDGALDSSDGELKDDEDCEDGEIKEPGLKKPFVRPLCRFFSRGNCSWGVNCRFLHPGVNDKGNYSMMDQSGQNRSRSSATPWLQELKENLPPPPPALENQPETAWERGLRHLKEMKKRQKEPGEPDIKIEPGLKAPEQPVVKPPVVPPIYGPRDPYYDEPFRPPPVHSSYETYPAYPQMGMPPHMMPPPGEGWMYPRPPFDYGWMRPGYPPHPEFFPPPGFPLPYSDPNMMNRGGKMSPPIRMEHVDKFGRTVQGMPDMPPGYEAMATHPDMWKEPWARSKSPTKKSASRSRSGSRRHRRSGSYSSFTSSSNSSKSRSGSSFSSSSSGSSSSSSVNSSKSPNRERKVPKKPPNFNKLNNTTKSKIHLPPIPGTTVPVDTGSMFDEKVTIPISVPKPTIISVGKPNQLGSLAQSVVDAFKEGDDLDIFGRSSRGMQPLPSMKSPTRAPALDYSKPPPSIPNQTSVPNAALAGQFSKIYPKIPQITTADLLKVNGELLAKRARSRSSFSSSSSSSSTSAAGSDHLYDNIASPISSESSLSPDSEPEAPQQTFKYTVHDKRAPEFQPRGMRPHYRMPYDPSMRGAYRPFHHRMIPPDMYRHPMPYRMVRVPYEPRMRREYIRPEEEEEPEDRDEDREMREQIGDRRRYSGPYERPESREENNRQEYRGQEQYDHSNMQERHMSTHRSYSRTSYYKDAPLRRSEEREPSHHHVHRSRQMASGDHHRGTHHRSSNRSTERHHKLIEHHNRPMEWEPRVPERHHKSIESRHKSRDKRHISDERRHQLDDRVPRYDTKMRRAEPVVMRKRSPIESSISPQPSPPPKQLRMDLEGKTQIKATQLKYSDYQKHDRKYEQEEIIDQHSPSPLSPQKSPPPVAELPKKKKVPTATLR